MQHRNSRSLSRLLATMAVVALGASAHPAAAAGKKLQTVTAQDKKAAATRAAALGLTPGLSGVTVSAGSLPLGGTEGPGGIPHYFGPYANWALSPLPMGSIASVTLTAGGSGYVSPTVTIKDAYGTASPLATVTATVTGGVITALTITDPGAGYTAPVVIIEDVVPVGGIPGTGATADATIGGPLTGGIRKFVDGMPGLGAGSANALGQYIPVAVPDTATYAGSDYYEIALVEFWEKMHSDLPPTLLRGYVQLASPGRPCGIQLYGTTPSGARGPALQLPDGRPALACEPPHQLGPVIVAYGRAHGVPSAAGAPVPARIKFYNLLPAGSAGDLYIPVDETVMGSGLGPALPGVAGSKFTQNRATIHLHGNNTVWISDGNTHQWITPADDFTPYPKGVSVRNVPDMLEPPNNNVVCDVAPVGKNSSGCMTFFYTNAQSARLQFYHDHAMGITRLNVYSGEAAGYVITDAVDQDLINGTNVSGVNPGLQRVLPDVGIPLVIQDKTWVDANTIFAQDPTWNDGTGLRDPVTGNITAGVTGDLWYPHVYMTVQNPWDLGGVNPFGRWHYGPWFNPPVPECVNGLPVGCIELGPVPNEYYQPICATNPADPACTAPWEPPMRPGVPNPSIPGEGFMDTPLVNGTAYPYLEVEPRAYRFRVLSAANDRMFNLQLYVAADKKSPTTPGTTGTVLCDGINSVPVGDCTEVKMVPVNGAPNQYADTPSGIPDPTTAGPPWILIGTEGGFVPEPQVIAQQPVGWNLNASTFNFGVVNQHSLFLGSAERADVVVDFSAYAGKTLILYNDAPAPLPAGAPPYDYYTGAPSQLGAGGSPGTQPGYGPNTRTIMQIRVKAGTPVPIDVLANLRAAWAKTATKPGVFELTQEPIIIPQAAYNSAYNNSFTSTAAGQYVQIADTAKTFQPINEAGVLQPAVTLQLQMKGMHDEMGGVYDTMFGRMSGMLGLSNPLSPVHMLIPYGYSSPPTDVVMGSVEGTPIGVMPDGTQLWRIFHNGVDTHTIHTHLFHAQLINRVGQDGQQLGVDPIELGWKDTFRVNPLEVTYLAMRPTVPTPDLIPFEVPDSVRLIDPTLPEAATLIPPPPAGWFDPAGNAIPSILNHYVNFGAEYVWHCHILAHEEMDMMHSLVFAVPPRAPDRFTATVTGTANNPRVDLAWWDNSIKEAAYVVERAADASFKVGLTTLATINSANPGLMGQMAFQDTTVKPNNQYSYRVSAKGALVGDSWTAGFPTMTAVSIPATTTILVGAAPGTPNAPTTLTAVVQTGPKVSLTWRDNATNEAGFNVARCAGAGCTNFAVIATAPARNNTGNVTFVDTTVAWGITYQYQVTAVNSAGASAPTNTVAAVVPALPAAPTGFTVAVVKANGNNYTATLNWAAGTNPTNFTIQRATNLAFTTGLSTSTVSGTLRTTTQTVTKNTTYYYRIAATNSLGGASAWTNAQPFPIRTGP